MGGGRYRCEYHPPEDRGHVDEFKLADRIIGEFTDGVTGRASGPA